MSFTGPTRQLVSQTDAALVASPDIPRSRFLGAWGRKMTFDAGYLVPFMVDEVLPGDVLKYNVTAFVRMATPLFPVMDSQRIDTHFFFVPARLLWKSFVNMMGEQDTPGQSIDVTIPTLTSPAGGFAVGSIFDYFGLPTVGQVAAGQTVQVNALPLRAYNLIYHQWFRDQNLTAGVQPSVDDGPELLARFELKRRAKFHDYFTSALPWPQKFTAPSIPLLGTAPVLGISVGTGAAVTGGSPPSAKEASGQMAAGWHSYWYTSATNQIAIRSYSGTGSHPNVVADLSAASGVSINALRQAFLVQELLERDARGGTRYTEIMRNQFGVTSPDQRLQRAEYMGGGFSPLNVTPVAQTAPSTGANVGSLGAAATGLGQHAASVAATEHGYVLGLISVRTEQTYGQGLHKLWQRRTRLDFYVPALAQLGEQVIKRSELYCTGTPANDDAVFGYQERWAEYRQRHSDLAGLFRSTSTGTLDGWHLGQRFLTAPTLSTAFIEDNPPMDRVLAAGNLAAGQQYLADIRIERDAMRPLPAYSTPVSLGRF